MRNVTVLSLTALTLAACTAPSLPVAAASDAGLERVRLEATETGVAALGCGADDVAGHRVRGRRGDREVTVTVCCGPDRPGGCEVLDQLD